MKKLLLLIVLLLWASVGRAEWADNCTVLMDTEGKKVIGFVCDEPRAFLLVEGKGKCNVGDSCDIPATENDNFFVEPGHKRITRFMWATRVEQ